MLLGRHAGLLGVRVGFLLLLVRALGLAWLEVLGRWRLGLSWVLGVLLRVLLLLVLDGVGVLVVDGGLGCAGHVGRLGVLLHGDWEGQYVWCCECYNMAVCWKMTVLTTLFLHFVEYRQLCNSKFKINVNLQESHSYSESSENIEQLKSQTSNLHQAHRQRLY